jgi:predicted PilT family ATPase
MPSSIDTEDALFAAMAANDDAQGWEQQTLVLEVPNDKVGRVIGRAGNTIKELEQKSGARVKVTPNSNWQGRSEPRPIQLTGTQQQLNWCLGLISDKVGVPVEQLVSTQTFEGCAYVVKDTSVKVAPDYMRNRYSL